MLQMPWNTLGSQSVCVSQTEHVIGKPSSLPLSLRGSFLPGHEERGPWTRLLEERRHGEARPEPQAAQSSTSVDSLTELINFPIALTGHRLIGLTRTALVTPGVQGRGSE